VGQSIAFLMIGFVEIILGFLVECFSNKKNKDSAVIVLLLSGLVMLVIGMISSP